MPHLAYNHVKSVHFVGASREDLQQLDDAAKETLGFQLFKVQQGQDPDDWKPMSVVGPGVREIRVRESSGAYRLLYVAQFEEAVYVLNVFQKKEQKISAADVTLARARYRSMIQWRKEHGRH
jgi:phage-related protein